MKKEGRIEKIINIMKENKEELQEMTNQEMIKWFFENKNIEMNDNMLKKYKNKSGCFENIENRKIKINREKNKKIIHSLFRQKNKKNCKNEIE